MKKYNKIVLNIPHSSIQSYSTGWEQPEQMFPLVKNLTDWHTDTLFGGNSHPKIEEIVFNQSRFQVDVERLLNDPMEDIGQGILYTEYDGLHRAFGAEEQERLMNCYRAYHDRLDRAIVDDTFVLDCHSFHDPDSEVDVCLGFNDDESKPSDETINFVKEVFEKQGYSVAINAPYSNAITPNSEHFYHSLMIELNKRIYMDEETLLLKEPGFSNIKQCLKELYHTIL